MGKTGSIILQLLCEPHLCCDDCGHGETHLGRHDRLTQSCRRVARLAPQRIKPAILASSEVVERLPKRCRTIGGSANLLPHSTRNWGVRVSPEFRGERPASQDVARPLSDGGGVMRVGGLCARGAGRCPGARAFRRSLGGAGAEAPAMRREDQGPCCPRAHLVAVRSRASTKICGCFLGSVGGPLREPASLRGPRGRPHLLPPELSMRPSSP